MAESYAILLRVTSPTNPAIHRIHRPIAVHQVSIEVSRRNFRIASELDVLGLKLS